MDIRKKLQQKQRDSNPCQEESQLSLECLEENNYDHAKCVDYFNNYKNCNKFWAKVAHERKKQGIKPSMPSFEERKEILAKKEKKAFS